jgi:hypothetical protein
MSEQSNEETYANMDAAAVEAAKEFAKIMKANGSAVDLVTFHQKWYQKAGHKRLAKLYRDYVSS